MRKFLSDLDFVPPVQNPNTFFYDNSGAVALSKEPRHHKKSKHIERKYHRIHGYVNKEIMVEKIATVKNLADPFTKTLAEKVFSTHVESIGIKCCKSDL